MQETQLSVLLFWAIFLSAAASVAAVAHYFIRSTMVANFTSVIVVVLALAIIDTIKLGYFDGWLIIAVPIAGFIAGVVSFLIGALLDRAGMTRRVRTHVA
jgi:hypothetical protein